ncbi:MAG TPA: PEPxxWA-CTERM sorting domain-containing protein [Sphingomonas sp.]|uniref:PEPxxWA-CTERM sorting domain-containing protein n=1 Tax=Sphingomonas sp. TaxID=28214 RepID=UPI002C8F7231|nr:PEPxxWA-CTERM sorting domain-containing protein [Sphingomonas sp.]HMI18588.1 PEPxxWA-CTERM sorting domain-containing protein [Sphingomonas sp.]
MKTVMMRAALLASALGLAVPAAAQVRYFEFSVSGFTDGATLTGTFSGDDTNNDGTLAGYSALNLFEVTDFSAHFSGNSLVGAQDWTFADFQTNGGLFYDYGPTLNSMTGAYGADGVVVINPASFAMIGGPNGTGLQCDGTNPCFRIASLSGGVTYLDNTVESSVVTELDAPLGAPEPASWAMMLGGFGLIGAAMRQRTRRVRFA